MASEVDICNMALSYLGDRATMTSFDPPEGSAQSDHCYRFYPMALRELVSSAHWSFATKRIRLASMTTAVAGYEHAYQVPSDMIELQSVVTESGIKVNQYEVMRNGDVLAICTNEKIEYITYTTSEVMSHQFPPMFTEALARLLASKLAGCVISGTSGASISQEQLKYAELYKERAMAADARNTRFYDHVPHPFTADMELPEVNDRDFY